ncbi:hypothetical protein GP475_06050 [Corynebacterium poyangense]|uniref:Uncharacterized protein n=1 Tax=Corynebacterium poyangense TaxID=2684405 RepID=A0A7H0SNX2_9CORY|nr:DUF6676 family protein [Corynebacterium poyangense]QNQ90247.1 hypothetical protein GP475_06050 [Corynebacterium poyangense]
MDALQSDLAQQLAEGHVAIESPHLGDSPFVDQEGKLSQIAVEAENDGFGSLGIVIVNHDPSEAGGLRNLGIDLLNDSDLDTIVLRSPTIVDVVSKTHHRAELEIGRNNLAQNLDPVAYPGQLHAFIADLDNYSAPWGMFSLIAAIVVGAVFVAAWRAARTAFIR